MNTFWQIIKRHAYIGFFVVLMFISLQLFFRYHSYQQSMVHGFGLEVQGGMNASTQRIQQLFYLRKTNAALQAENAELRALAAMSHVPRPQADSTVRDSLYRQLYTYLPAQILYNSTDMKNNHLLLNVGRRDGVFPGMAVIAPQGVVGIVKEVSSHFSSVLSVLHSQSKVSVRLSSEAYSGSLYWNGKTSDMAEMDEIPSHVVVRKGEKVLTSGYSLVYPPGIEVGRVVEVLSKPGDEFQRLSVRLVQDFKALDRVYVVKNLYRMELDSLMTGDMAGWPIRQAPEEPEE